MKYTQVAADAFQKLQLNAGVLLTEFDPEKGDLDRTKIFAATGGGVSFTATPELIDFGDDIDNVPSNTKQLTQIDYYTVEMSGTAKTADTEMARMLIGAADIQGDKIVPRTDIMDKDFGDIWWVGDYGDDHDGEDAGFMAIKMTNVLNTGGFSMQSNDKGKADFAFTFRCFYDLEDITKVPFEIYINGGGARG